MNNCKQDEDFGLDNVRASERLDIAEKLLDFNASREEALDWYYANDPLSQDLNMLSAKIASGNYGSRGENLQNYFNAISLRPSYYEHAGLTLLINIIDPESTEDPLVPWSEKLPKDFTKNYPWAFGNEIVAYPLLAHLPKAMSPDQLEQAYIALDCLHYAGAAFSSAHSFIIDGLTEFIDPFDLATIDSKYRVYSDASFQLAVVIGLQALQEKNKDDPTIRKIGLQVNQYMNTALINKASTMDTPENNESLNLLRTATMAHAFNDLIEGISRYFLDSSSTDRKVIKGEEKGLLHESLWLLDMNFILFMDKTVKNTYVVPTFPRIDRPKIGRPIYNRAYDMHVQFGTTGRTLPVQLKSSNNAAKNMQYHPNIDVVVEENFADVDIRRLSAKMAKYKAWSASGLSDEAAIEVQKYLLPSAIEYLDRIHEVNGLDEATYFLSKVATAGLDRAARRRIARAIRKNR